MKNVKGIFIVLVLSVLLAGCGQKSEKERYAEAIEKYENAEFEEAKEMFSKLNGYEDSVLYIRRCDVMESLQGTYYLEPEAKMTLTITGFLMDWDGTVLGIQLEETPLRLTVVEYNELGINFSFSIDFQDGEAVLIYEGVRIKSVYRKIK